MSKRRKRRLRRALGFRLESLRLLAIKSGDIHLQDVFTEVANDKSMMKVLSRRLRRQVGSDRETPILDWIIANPEEFLAFLQLIIKLFSGGLSASARAVEVSQDGGAL